MRGQHDEQVHKWWTCGGGRTSFLQDDAIAPLSGATQGGWHYPSQPNCDTWTASKRHSSVLPNDPSNTHWLTHVATQLCRASVAENYAWITTSTKLLLFSNGKAATKKLTSAHPKPLLTINRPREFGTTPYPTPKECSSTAFAPTVVQQCTRLSSLTSNKMLIHYYQFKNGFHCRTERSQGYLCDFKKPLMQVCRDLISGCMMQFNPFSPSFDHLAQVFASL